MAVKLLRAIVGLLVLLTALGISAACAPTAAPAPTSAPTAAKPTVVAKPTEPAATATAKPAASSNWQAEWETTLAAAKQEGKAVVIGAAGDQVRQAFGEFEKAYPDIKLDFMGGASRDFVPKVLTEQSAGQYLVDAWVTGAATGLTSLLPKNALAPLRPALILPEVLDDSKWHSGFEAGWMDRQHEYVYQVIGYLSPGALVNRDVASASELSSFDQLLDPKWQGKIVWQDPRVAGSGQNTASRMLFVKGEDWLRKILGNGIVPLTDARAMVEGLVRGSYVVAIGTRPAQVFEFKTQGLGLHVEALDPDSPLGADKSGGQGHVTLLKNAPHPNAAKVFINWFFSREAQQKYTDLTSQNSRRLDVKGPAETALKPEVTYVDLDKEENLGYIDRANKIAADVLK